MNRLTKLFASLLRRACVQSPAIYKPRWATLGLENLNERCLPSGNPLGDSLPLSDPREGGTVAAEFSAPKAGDGQQVFHSTAPSSGAGLGTNAELIALASDSHASGGGGGAGKVTFQAVSGGGEEEIQTSQIAPSSGSGADTVRFFEFDAVASAALPEGQDPNIVPLTFIHRHPT